MFGKKVYDFVQIPDFAVFVLALSMQASAGIVGQWLLDETSGTVAKDVFEKMYVEGESAEAIVERDGLAQIDDANALSGTVREVLSQHADAVEQYRSGKRGALGFLVGQVMKATQGKANPKVVDKLLREAIDG